MKQKIAPFQDRIYGFMAQVPRAILNSVTHNFKIEEVLVFFLLFFFCLIPASDAVSQDLKTEYDHAVTYLQEGSYDEAITAFDRVLEIKPDLAMAHNLQGYAYMQKEGFVTSAKTALLTALQYDPRLVDAYFNLATLYGSQLHDTDRAIQYFEKAIAVNPKYGRAYFGLAWLELIEKHDPLKAAELFHKTLQLIPELPEAYYGLGLCYLQANKRELSLEPISMLRRYQREDLAQKLELLMHTGDIGMIANTESPQGEGVQPPAEQTAESAPAPQSQSAQGQAIQPTDPGDDFLPVE